MFIRRLIISFVAIPLVKRSLTTGASSQIIITEFTQVRGDRQSDAQATLDHHQLLFSC